MLSHGATVWSPVVRIVVDAAKRRGLSDKAFRQSFGFSCAAFEKVTRVPIAIARQVWTHLPEMVGEPELGVLAVEEAGESAYGFFNRLVESSATWGRAMDRMSFCVSLANGAAGLNLVHDRATISVVLEPGNGVRTGMDLMSTSICLRTRAHMGEAIRPLQVRYACPKPRKTVEYERVFGVSVEFEAPRTELVYDRSLYDTPVPRARTEVGDVLEALVLRAAKAFSGVTSLSRESDAPPTHNTSAFLTEVTLALQVCIEQGTAQLSHVATAMGLSSRSLQRYLHESQCSFRELVGQQRAELAMRSAALRSKAATARMLGYSDRRSLRRAATRWREGHGPLRQELGAEVSASDRMSGEPLPSTRDVVGRRETAGNR